MTKKLLLVGFASRLAPGSLEQSVLAVIVSLLFLVLHLQSRPYKAELDNVVATATHLTLAMFFIWCTLLQTGVLGDPEDYNPPSGSGSIISIVMLLSAVGVIVIAVVLFVAETIARRAASYDSAARRAMVSARKRAMAMTITPMAERSMTIEIVEPEPLREP